MRQVVFIFTKYKFSITCKFVSTCSSVTRNLPTFLKWSKKHLHMKMISILTFQQSYCWWLKSCTSWGNGSLSHYLRGFIHPRWSFGISEPSTVVQCNMFSPWKSWKTLIPEDGEAIDLAFNKKRADDRKDRVQHRWKSSTWIGPPKPSN